MDNGAQQQDTISTECSCLHSLGGASQASGSEINHNAHIAHTCGEDKNSLPDAYEALPRECKQLHSVEIVQLKTARVQRTSIRTLYGATGPENSKKKTRQKCLTETLNFVASGAKQDTKPTQVTYSVLALCLAALLYLYFVVYMDFQLVILRAFSVNGALELQRPQCICLYVNVRGVRYLEIYCEYGQFRLNGSSRKLDRAIQGGVALCIAKYFVNSGCRQDSRGVLCFLQGRRCLPTATSGMVSTIKA